jgi:DedD protein
VDRHLKERLVGAAVLVAAAIILIPEMLSGTSESVTTPGPNSTALPAAADGGALKTYTIDLGKATSDSVTKTIEVTPAPPPELPVVELPAEEPSPASQPNTQLAADQKADQEKPDQKTPEQKSSAPAEKTAAPMVSKELPGEGAREPLKASSRVTQTADNIEVLSVPKSAKTGTQWAVQVASFDTRDKSQKIVDAMKAKGLPAFVASSQVNGKTVYRARVGPADDRAEAEALLRKVKSLHPKAAIMPHP